MGAALRVSARLPRKAPRARPPRIPNNAGRRVKSPTIPVNVEMMYALVLERVAARFAKIVGDLVLPRVAHFAYPSGDDVERADAEVKPAPAPALPVRPPPVPIPPTSPAGVLLRHMKKKHAGGDPLGGPGDLEGVVLEGVLSAASSAADTLLTAMRAASDRSFKASEPEMRKGAFVASERTLKHSKHEFKRLAIDVRKEPMLTPLMDGWRKDNVALIRNMQDEQVSKIDEILREGYGHRAETLAKRIEEQVGGISRRRARLIARDQVLKLHAKITRHRQQSAGIKKYVWTTSLDERVRPEHEELEGETFSWDGEGDPEEGHPGDAVNCRCVAYPVLENDFLDDEDD